MTLVQRRRGVVAVVASALLLLAALTVTATPVGAEHVDGFAIIQKAGGGT